MKPILSLTKTLLPILLAVSCPAFLHADDISFTRDIRPILSNKCYKCHGPDEDARVTEMRLDTEQGLFSSNTPPITPGNLKTSSLAERILSQDPNFRMPPASANKNLTEDEVLLLTRWIKRGAKYEPHWAFQLPQDVRPKPTRKAVSGHHPIDHYIVTRLDSVGLDLSLIHI